MSVKVAVLGYGVVGSGVVELFYKNRKSIEKHAGCEMDIKYIVDIREFPDSPYKDKFTKDFNEVLNDPEVTVVAECMGGTEPAHSTDAVSAILAEYIQADKLINLTSVDGMYTKDPNKFDDAELVPEITATDLLEFLSGKDVKAGTYEFFDTTADQMIKRSNLETVITNGFEPENLIKAVNGEKVGTRVISE